MGEVSLFLELDNLNFSILLNCHSLPPIINLQEPAVNTGGNLPA